MSQQAEPQRVDLGFADALDDLDLTAWKPASPFRAQKATPKKPAAATVDRQAAAQMAAEAGFHSREPKSPAQPAAAPQRRRRTGRNAQFNLKAKPETIAAYCALADARGWGLGETLERAVELLQKHYGR